MTLLDPRLYLVVDPVDGPGRPADVVRAAVAGGVTAVQVRAPRASGGALHDATVAVRELLAGSGVAVVVDDRLDIAMAARADGVHLGARDLPVPAARHVAGHLHIGWSVTGDDDLDRAAVMAPGSVDLLGIGPVFPSTTKTEGGPGMGVEGLSALVRRVGHEVAAPGGHVPTVAIGGIDAARAHAVLATGVDGIAVSAAITTSPDPEATAAVLRAAVDDGPHRERSVSADPPSGHLHHGG